MQFLCPRRSGPAYTGLTVLLLLLSISAIAQTRDGKLLQGEKWQKFSIGQQKPDFIVSPAGNDSWSGTLAEPNASRTDGPFATLDRARKAVRELKSKVYSPKDPPVEKRWIGSPHPFGKGRDILVLVRDGHYYLDKSLTFTPEECGERVETNLPTGAFEYHKVKDHYVTFAAWPGEKPVISACRPVTGWKAAKGIWSASLEADTVTMFLVNGKKQVLARKPNSGYFTPASVSKKTDELNFSKGDIEDWKNLAGNRIVMLLRWHTGINSISRVDNKTRTAWLLAPQDGLVIVPPRYYVENLKALLDTAGEWYYDKPARTISYIPIPDIKDVNQAFPSIPVLDNLVTVRGEKGHPARNLRLYGFTFEGTGPGNSAVSFEYAHACELAEGTLRSCAGTGVSVRTGCYQVRIFGNQVESIDNGGIYVTGSVKPVWKSVADYNNGIRPVTGSEIPDIIRETTITHNKVSDCGGVGILATNTLSTTISHNYIARTRGRFGINVGEWPNQEDALDGNYTVEYNHFEDVQRDADDSGSIETAGMVFNSYVRKNLIHRVHAGFFNDNVAFWFDNMSQGWITEDNIYYDLEQGEMKYCAAVPEDNIYRNNFIIEPPTVAPETIIDGEPSFRYSKLSLFPGSTASTSYPAGSLIEVSASVFNNGSTGILPVELYVDGRVREKKPFPVIAKNSRTITFQVRIYEAGDHTLGIGTTPDVKVKIEGTKPSVVYEDFKLSAVRCLEGEKVGLQATARNLSDQPQHDAGAVYIDGLVVANFPSDLKENESKPVKAEVVVPAGKHQVRIGNSATADLLVQPAKYLELRKEALSEYGSPRARPFAMEANPAGNMFRISASGSDFYHAEDSYASIYLKGVKGDFVATVTITGFGPRTHEWFRSGLFVRNDIARSFDVLPGSRGSVLLFGTPGRAGIQYDEFANGCMHKASSQNLPEHSKTPIYLKLVRHGNSFSGYASLDGTNWILTRETPAIPMLNEAVDVGLAAGGPDTQQYHVEFSDWKIRVAQ